MQKLTDLKIKVHFFFSTQLHLAVAVDFSWMPGEEPHDPSKFDIDFQCAIKGIGGIIRDYSP